MGAPYPLPDQICPKRALRRRCAEMFGVDEARMIGGNRRRDIIVARHATCYVLRQRFPLFSLPRLGRLMGGRDHTTMIAAIRQTEARMARDPKLAGQIHALIACPNGNLRYHDAHVRQWRAYQQARSSLLSLVSAAPPDLGDELAEFMAPDRVWCGQCDASVSLGAAVVCKRAFCRVRASDKVAA